MLNWDEFDSSEKEKKPQEKVKQTAPVETKAAVQAEEKESPIEMNVTLETGSVSSRLERAKKGCRKI